MLAPAGTPCLDERYSVVDVVTLRHRSAVDVIPAPRPLTVVGRRSSLIRAVALSIGGGIVVLAIAVAVLGRAPGGPLADLPLTSPSVLPSDEPRPSPSGVPRELEGTPPGWFSVRPHIWTAPVGPQGFYANVPIADPARPSS
jgi:hypothetical protein